MESMPSPRMLTISIEKTNDSLIRDQGKMCANINRLLLYNNDMNEFNYIQESNLQIDTCIRLYTLRINNGSSGSTCMLLSEDRNTTSSICMLVFSEHKISSHKSRQDLTRKLLS